MLEVTADQSVADVPDESTGSSCVEFAVARVFRSLRSRWACGSLISSKPRTGTVTLRTMPFYTEGLRLTDFE
jgi:hypothetical protein